VLDGAVARRDAGRAHRLQRPWAELLTAKRAGIVKLSDGRVDVTVVELEAWLRAEGLAGLVAELRRAIALARPARAVPAESGFGGGTLVVRIPMWLRRQRGRKRIMARDASELTLPTRPQPDRVVARRWLARGAGRGCWTPASTVR
jgi:hypothetical protein